MLGAIIGDICGSVYEWRNMKTARPYDIPLDKPDCRFTDDTVLIMAVAEACLGDRDYAKALKSWGRRYHEVGYGTMFRKWLAATDNAPYGSFGNGSAMRVVPIGWLFDTLDETLDEAKRSAKATHNHPEGIKGAQAVAAAIFWARTGKSKKTIRRQIKRRFGYNLDRNISNIRPNYSFDATCQGSVPEAIVAFLDSHDFEHAIRLAISLGGDSDTIACITGSIAEAFYIGVSDAFWEFAEAKITPEMRLIVEQFSNHRISPVRPDASDYANFEWYRSDIGPGIYELLRKDLDKLLDSMEIVSQERYFKLSLRDRIKSIKVVNEYLKTIHINVLKWGQLHGLIPPESYEDTVKEESALGEYLVCVGLMTPGGGATAAQRLTAIARIRLPLVDVITALVLWNRDLTAAQMTIVDTITFAIFSWSRNMQFAKVIKKVEAEKNKAREFFKLQLEQDDGELRLSEQWIF